MNTWEINDAADRHRAHPVLGPATRLLQAYRDIIDQNSDGWAYWASGSRAANKLQELIQDGPEEATEMQLRHAHRTIKSFCTRHKLPQPLLETAATRAAAQGQTGD